MSMLTGKVAGIPDASKGIGAATAKNLVRMAPLRPLTLLQQGRHSYSGANHHQRWRKAIAIQGNVSKSAEVEGHTHTAIATCGRLDILVNNSDVLVSLRTSPMSSLR